MAQQIFRRLFNLALLVSGLLLMSAPAFAQYPIGNSHLSDMKPGSILFYNRYTSNPGNPRAGDTQINITNTNQTEDVAVHLFLVDGSTCTIADAFISLTKNQTASFLMSDIDPGVSGYIVAVASEGGPIQFNWLIGTEYIRETDGRTAALQAVSVARRNPAPVLPNSDSTAALVFNDVEYERLPNALALASFNSQTTDSTTLSIYSPSSNLLIGNVETVNVFVLLYNDAEVALSSSFSLRCYRYDSLTSLFNRSGGINRHVPTGSTGWIRMTASGRPLLGSALHRGPVFVGGHNLHALSLLSSYTILVPAL